MSQSTVASFFDFAKTSESIKTQLEKGMSLISIVNTAVEKGYKFNEQELQEYLASSDCNQELSLENLESVAGGKTTVSCTVSKEF